MSDRTITEEEYKELRRAALLLNALEAGGVDNWDWYSDAYQDFIKAAKKENLLLEGEDDV